MPGICWSVFPVNVGGWRDNDIWGTTGETITESSPASRGDAISSAIASSCGGCWITEALTGHCGRWGRQGEGVTGRGGDKGTR